MTIFELMHELNLLRNDLPKDCEIIVSTDYEGDFYINGTMRVIKKVFGEEITERVALICTTNKE